MNTEEHIIELESRLAFQENSISELNEIITRQQQQLDILQASVRLLNDKIHEISDTSPAAAPIDEKPPHY